MSRAEDLARQKYPNDEPIDCVRCHVGVYKREGFVAGYHQAEEDLALAWEDIPKILHICENLKTSWWFMDNEQTKQIGTQPFWEEILRQFNEEKGNKA